MNLRANERERWMVRESSVGSGMAQGGLGLAVDPFVSKTGRCRRGAAAACRGTDQKGRRPRMNWVAVAAH